jgi:hypothetical protein
MLFLEHEQSTKCHRPALNVQTKRTPEFVSLVLDICLVACIADKVPKLVITVRSS